MKTRSTIVTIIIAFLVSHGLCQDASDDFAKEIEKATKEVDWNHPAGWKRIEEIRLDPRDWEEHLLKIIASGEPQGAIGLLALRETLSQPRCEKVVGDYFKESVKQARARDKSDERQNASASLSVGMATTLARHGGPNLLLAALNVAVSDEEQADPLLPGGSVEGIVRALLVKGDERHVEGMKKLLEITKDPEIKEKLLIALQQPRTEKVVGDYFKERVKYARALDKSDKAKEYRAPKDVRELANHLARDSRGELLLVVLNEASSEDEQADPLLGEYGIQEIINVLQTKADARHLEGMQKLLKKIENPYLKEKLSRAIHARGRMNASKEKDK